MQLKKLLTLLSVVCILTTPFAGTVSADNIDNKPEQTLQTKEQSNSYTTFVVPSTPGNNNSAVYRGVKAAFWLI